MLQEIPSVEQQKKLIGEELYAIWEELVSTIHNQYETEETWNSGGKAWTYEYKYRRGGKTLCALYMKEHCIGFMVIFGKAEREQFEQKRDSFSLPIQNSYEEATTYHDGKWIMFYPQDTTVFTDYMKLLTLKRKPNRK